MQNEVINILPHQENHVIGFADMGNLIQEHYPYRYAVVVGKKLDDAIVDGIEDGPTMPYYELYNSTNDELNLITAKISRFLMQNGIPCLQIKSTVQENDPPEGFDKTLRMNFSHKMAATRAGLGWIGKTDLLVSEKFGPRSECALCVEMCPGPAANGKEAGAAGYETGGEAPHGRHRSTGQCGSGGACAGADRRRRSGLDVPA